VLYPELDIAIRLLSDRPHGQPADSAYVVHIRVPEEVDTDAVTKVLLDLVHASDQHDGIMIHETRDIYEWGGSSVSWGYVVDLLASVDDVAVGIAVAKAFDKITAIVGSKNEQPPLDRDGALSSARWAVLRDNDDLDHESLELVSEDHDREANRWTFGFRPGDGYEYTAEVGWHGKLPGVARVKRTRV
jgi:hypothetical protein